MGSEALRTADYRHRLTADDLVGTNGTVVMLDGRPLLFLVRHGRWNCTGLVTGLDDASPFTRQFVEAVHVISTHSIDGFLDEVAIVLAHHPVAN